MPILPIDWSAATSGIIDLLVFNYLTINGGAQSLISLPSTALMQASKSRKVSRQYQACFLLISLAPRPASLGAAEGT